MSEPQTGRAVKQDDWKRTQIRMPQDHYQKIMEYAEANNISLNTAMLELIEKGFAAEGIGGRVNLSEADVRIFNLKDGTQRVVFGKFVNSLDLDYSQSLDALRIDIELALDALRRSSFLKQLSFLNRDVLVYQGGHHIDVVDNGEKSLGWLKVEDYSPDVIDD
ncbi:hypothetical protein [Vitreoscilla stercoraria]|uniref:Arc-like DNA binding domain-containing protein n=1 Tax=Vitreoscilla stercoraria TaxID=61 RepID=A0ABY4ECE4_VITST|nr:hypothetical protein [Vitreoscilla stercoraria]UOO93416.1 hypothetical protein LVJ81_05140 [Vitreoscilla stercoraria]